MHKDPNRRRLPLSERLVQVIDDRQTGETLLDEALKMMKAQEAVERMSVNSWIDLLSGACWILHPTLLQGSVLYWTAILVVVLSGSILALQSRQQ